MEGEGRGRKEGKREGRGREGEGRGGGRKEGKGTKALVTFIHLQTLCWPTDCQFVSGVPIRPSSPHIQHEPKLGLQRHQSAP